MTSYQEEKKKLTKLFKKWGPPIGYKKEIRRYQDKWGHYTMLKLLFRKDIWHNPFFGTTYKTCSYIVPLKHFKTFIKKVGRTNG